VTPSRLTGAHQLGVELLRALGVAARITSYIRCTTNVGHDLKRMNSKVSKKMAKIEDNNMERNMSSNAVDTKDSGCHACAGSIEEELKMNKPNPDIQPVKIPVNLNPLFPWVVQIEHITPTLALVYLASQENTNRRVNKRRVSAYAPIMREHKWQLTPQGIAFDTRGHLVDGQHRLWAIIESGVTVSLLVVYGLSDDAIRALDRGWIRSVSEALRRGSSIPATLKPDLARIGSWATSEYLMLTGTNLQSDPEQVEAYFGKNSGAIEELLPMLSARWLKAASIGASLVFAMQEYPDQTYQFLGAMIKGADLAEDSPALVLRNLLEHSVGKVAEQRRSLALRILQALKVHIQNGTLKDSDSLRADRLISKGQLTKLGTEVIAFFQPESPAA